MLYFVHPDQLALVSAPLTIEIRTHHHCWRWTMLSWLLAYHPPPVGLRLNPQSIPKQKKLHLTPAEIVRPSWALYLCCNNRVFCSDWNSHWSHLKQDEEDAEQLHRCLQILSNVPVDSPRIRMVDGVDVPLHVVHIITLVIAHGAGEEPLPLLAVHFAVVDLNTSQRI